jgi:hypothetical protein
MRLAMRVPNTRSDLVYSASVPVADIDPEVLLRGVILVVLRIYEIPLSVRVPFLS